MMDFNQLREKCPWHDTYPEQNEDHETIGEHQVCGVVDKPYDSCTEKNCAVWYFVNALKAKGDN